MPVNLAARVGRLAALIAGTATAPSCRERPRNRHVTARGVARVRDRRFTIRVNAARAGTYSVRLGG